MSKTKSKRDFFGIERELVPVRAKPRASAGPKSLKVGESFTWHTSTGAHETRIEETCPICGVAAIAKLPPDMLAKQTDGTTHVCHPTFGGCNHGFEKDGNAEAYAVALAAEDVFRKELVRVYGERRAVEMRYRRHHDDPVLAAAAEAFVTANEAWMATMRGAKKS